MCISDLLPTVLAFIGGFVTAIFAEPLRRWFWRPRLELTFKKTDHFVTKTPEGDPPQQHEAFYIRVRAMNASHWLAKACRAYLVNMERMGKSGAWESTDYCESMQLAWASRKEGAFSALDLPSEVPHFFDVVSTRESSVSFRPEINAMPKRYETLLKTPGTYRFTILVSGDDVKPARIQLSFKWSGKWNDFEAEQV